MSNHSTMLMRAICEELTSRIIPELKSADAIERASFSRLVLQNLAAEIDVFADVGATQVPQMRATIAGALDTLASGGFADAAAAWRTELAAIPAEQDLARQREVAALRTLGSRIVRHLTDSTKGTLDAADAARVDDVISVLGGIDHHWLVATDAARAQRNAGSAPAAGDNTAATAASAVVDIDTVTRYLRQRFPDAPDIRATDVTPIPGGRSKKTWFLTIAGSDALPANLVMRQDYALRYEGTKVRDEYQPLLRLSQLGLPVPTPLLLEADESLLGPPFILVHRLQGKPPGTYFGMQGSCPNAFADLARTLAKLHRADPAELGLAVPAQPEKSLMRLIDTYEKKWRDNATKPSPLIDFAYAWARRECAREDGLVAVVHGDSGPYNFLVDNDRLTALLDWEFVRVSDPAEDLGIARLYAEQDMPWDTFMRIYQEAGGGAVSERRVQLGMLIQWLKGTTLVAASGRNYEEGWTREFIKGANAYTGLTLIELKIAGILKRFGAV